MNHRGLKFKATQNKGFNSCHQSSFIHLLTVRLKFEKLVDHLALFKYCYLLFRYFKTHWYYCY